LAGRPEAKFTQTPEQIAARIASVVAVDDLLKALKSCLNKEMPSIREGIGGTIWNSYDKNFKPNRANVGGDHDIISSKLINAIITFQGQHWTAPVIGIATNFSAAINALNDFRNLIGNAFKAIAES
jgi:hypothetical protein